MMFTSILENRKCTNKEYSNLLFYEQTYMFQILIAFFACSTFLSFNMKSYNTIMTHTIKPVLTHCINGYQCLLIKSIYKVGKLVTICEVKRR